MHANQIPTKHKALFLKNKLIIFDLKFKNQKKLLLFIWLGIDDIYFKKLNFSI